MNNEINMRSGNERRIAKRTVTFPLHDSQGNLITKDRRINPDRRSSGLEVTESKISQAAFNDHFKKYKNGDES